MVKVTIKASVEVSGGQTAFYSSDIGPGTSVYSTVEVGTAPVTVKLLPAQSDPILLAISAKYEDGQPADLTVIPIGDNNLQLDKGSFTVSGSLLVANQDLLEKLIKDGPKGLKLKLANPPAAEKDAEGNDLPEKKAHVEIIAAIASEPPAAGDNGGGGNDDDDGDVDNDDDDDGN